MSTDYTSDEIERDIERERTELNQTLHDLRDRLSVEGISRQLSDEFRAHSGEIGHAVSRTVKENPVGLALTGIGLAWLAFGGGRDHDNGALHGNGHGGSRDDGYGARHLPPSRGAEPYRTGVVRSYPTRPASFSDGTDTHHDDGSGLRDHASHAGDKVREGASGAGQAVSDRARKLRDGARDVAGGARDRARDARRRARSSAESLRESIHAGTERLSAEGRARVVAARRRAVEARAAAERIAERNVGDAYEQQPLVFGALAVAVGAALAGALPRSRFEDDTLGAQSDALFDEAEEIFEAEREKAMAVARVTGAEAADIAQETKEELRDATGGERLSDTARAKAQEAGEAAKAKAEDAADRLSRTAKEEAERQNLGKGKD